MSDVFISHASENADSAMELCDYLEENGVKCWIAPRDTPLGANFLTKIQRNIKQCAALVVILSADKSPNGMWRNLGRKFTDLYSQFEIESP